MDSVTSCANSGNGWSGWGVFLATSLDDVPVRLCESQAEAETIVDEIRECSADHEEVSHAFHVLGRDKPATVTVYILRFRGGRPQELRHMWSTDGVGRIA